MFSMSLQQVLLTSLLSFVSAANEIIVSSNATCETTEPHQRHCQSLVDAAKQVTSNTVIKIADIKYTLAGVARFDRVENVTITGNGKYKTEITCSMNNITTGAGIIFENSTDIRLKDFTITNCGVTIAANNVSNHAGTASAIQIIDCSRVVVSSILVSNSSQGLTFIDTLSSEVVDSQFINNSIQNGTEWPGGGGLQILFMHMNQSNGANYSILRNTFANNTANSQEVCYASQGGGIRILLFNECKNVQMELDNNVIEGNRAMFGGGLLVILSGNASHYNIHISSNRFIRNTAHSGGGGGAEVGFTLYLNSIYQYENLYPLHNNVTIFNATFLSNTATFGGGLFLFAGSIEFHAKCFLNNFVCTSCHFENNKAKNGAALSVNVDAFKITGTQFILSVTFFDCSFEQQNVVRDSQQKSFGTVYASLLPVTFNGMTVFVNNTGTALYMESVTVTFDDNSQVFFERNSGYHGGGIHMFGQSELHVCNNSYLKFQNNTATMYGGALSVENNQANIFSFVSVCFLRVSVLASSNVTFFFQGNTAQLGNDIYATTLAPCTALCKFRSGSKSALVANSSYFLSRSCLGNFSFSDCSDNLTNHVATSPKNILTNTGDSPLLKLTPGILSTLNITQIDEFGANVGNFFSLSAKVENSSQCVTIHPDYTIVEKNEIILLGSPKACGQLFLESQSAAGQTFDFELNDCPPGFILENPGCDAKCICFSLISNTSKSYKNLRCAPNGSVQIEYGHWVGYANTSNLSQDTLYTSDCLVELCNFDDPKLMTLPELPAQLEMKICSENRIGCLCGKCKGNMSVQYHSISYTCGDSTNCKFGIPLYIVSELLPVTIFFSIILLFNIRLTSGALYGFVFYAQVLSVLYLTAFGSIQIENKFVNGLVVAFQIFLGLFNLDILDGIWEYCVVQTNTIMTLFIIRYITIVYSFLLVAATVVVLRLHSCYHCVKICKKCGRRNIRGSIVDGLAAFLMVCYFQCANNTYRILCYSEIYGIGKKFIKNVAIFDGEMPYLEGEHWFYAVPAFLCIIIILIPPPTILLLEPFLTKFFSRERFNGSYLKKKYYRLRLKLMPFLDSFQACFKDRHRYFAGLYFLYRLIIPIVALFSQSIAQIYTMTAMMMLIILFIHVVLQPYSKKWHNVVEQSMFFNLILMHCITLYNYMQIHIQDQWTNAANACMYVQLVLISLPISYIFCYATVVIYKKYHRNLQLLWKNTSSRSVDSGTSNTDDSEIPARLLMESSNDPFSNNYNSL